MAQLDASLIGGFQPIQIPDQTNLLLKGLQAQGLIGQNQLQQLQIGQQQQSYARQNALMQYLASPDGQSDDLNTRINKSVMLDPINGPKIAESYLNTQKTQADIASTQATTDKTRQDSEHQQVVQTGSLLGAAAATGNPQNVIDAITKSPTIPEAQRAVLLQQAQKKGPIAFANEFAYGTMTADQQMTAGRPGVIESPTGPVSYNKANPNAGFTIMQPVGQGAPQGPPQPATPGAGAYGGGPSPINAVYLDPSQVGQSPQAAPPRSPQTQAAMDAIDAQATASKPAAPAPTNPFMKFETKTDPSTGRLVAVSTTPGPDGNFVVKPISGGADDAPLVTPAAIDNAAKRYNLDGTLPPAGMGASGNMFRSQVLNRAAELNAGVDGTDQRANQLTAKGDATALAALTKQQSAISAFERTANDNAAMALDMSNKLDRTGVPILNAGLQFARTNTGSPEAAQFHAAVATFIGEYAKVMSGGTSGPTSDAARAKAGSLLTESMTQPQFAAVVKTLQQEMDNRMAGFNNEAAALRSKMTGHGATSSVAPELQSAYAKYGIQ